MKYSIIVPVYNCEDAISHCIDSILNQTEKDFELILVDDGSEDASGRICDRYSSQDFRVRAIHRRNSGVSAARNSGLNIATGKYVVFIDGDDVVEGDYLERLSANNNEADLVIIGFDDCDANGHRLKEFVTRNEDIFVRSEAERLCFLKSVDAGHVWAKRYKKSIIDENELRFDEKHRFAEDVIFNNAFALLMNSISYVEGCGYHYYHYEKETLAVIAKHTNFIERLAWRRQVIINSLEYKMIRDYYCDQVLYLLEKELLRISASASSLCEKNKSVKMILCDPTIQMCIGYRPHKLIKVVMWCVKKQFSLPIVLLYAHTAKK